MRSISPTWSATRCSSCWFSFSTSSVLSRSSFEKSRVLDRDDSLGRKVRNKTNLLVIEGADFLARKSETADQLVLLEHRHGDVAAHASKLDGCDAADAVASLSRNVIACPSWSTSATLTGSSCSEQTCVDRSHPSISRAACFVSKAGGVLYTHEPSGRPSGRCFQMSRRRYEQLSPAWLRRPAQARPESC